MGAETGPSGMTGGEERDGGEARMLGTLLPALPSENGQHRMQYLRRRQFCIRASGWKANQLMLLYRILGVSD